MLKENELETKKPINLGFNYLHKEENIMQQVNEEIDMDAKELTSILENYLKSLGLLTVKEKNYLGSNECPFDLTAGDENTLAIYGFEVKSDKDVLKRLNRQLHHYSFICENIFIVVHKKELPEWLPDWCGIIRITADKKIYEEKGSYKNDLFNISTGYAWDIIAKENGLAGSKDKLQKLFSEIIGIRKNILFNHYFAIQYDSTTNSSTFKKFFPLSDRQKTFIIGLTLEYQIKELEKEVKSLEKRFTIIKQIINIGGSYGSN